MFVVDNDIMGAPAKFDDRYRKYLSTRSLWLQTPEGDDDIEPGRFSKLNAGKPQQMLCTWCGVYSFLILLVTAALPRQQLLVFISICVYISL